MKMSQLDRSNYLRGLLVLAGRDRIVDPRERVMMLQFGEMLDFDRRFCEAAIDSLLQNKHINGEAVTFSGREIAECFLRDAIRIAHVDDQLHRLELAWLGKVALANGLTDEWVTLEVQRFCEAEGSLDTTAPLSIRDYL